MSNDRIPYKNPEGYPDPTAYEALSAAMAAMNANTTEPPRLTSDEVKTQRLIKTLKNMIDLAGYDLIARIEIKDRTTGRIYR